MITFKYEDQQTTSVKIDGKSVGKIVESRMGFRYYPRGHVQGGEFFSTLIGCKQSALRENPMPNDTQKWAEPLIARGILKPESTMSPEVRHAARIAWNEGGATMLAWSREQMDSVMAGGPFLPIPTNPYADAPDESKPEPPKPENPFDQVKA